MFVRQVGTGDWVNFDGWITKSMVIESQGIPSLKPRTIINSSITRIHHLVLINFEDYFVRTYERL